MKKVLLMILLGVFTMVLASCGNKNWTDYQLFHDGLLGVEKNDKWGFIDKDGETVIDFIYDGVSAFHDGVALVTVNDQYFLINENGENVLETTYDYLYRTTEGNLIYKEGDLEGLLSVKGQVILRAKYNSISDFNDGLARVKFNEKYGYINSVGKVVVEETYDYAYDFKNGMGIVKFNGKYGYVNKRGKVAIDLIYDEANSFEENGLAVVCVDETETCSLINDNGKSQFDAFEISGEGPLYKVKLEKTDENWKLYTEEGSAFTETEYTSIWSMRDYIINASTDGADDVFIIFNDKGETLHTVDYFSASPSYDPIKDVYYLGETSGFDLNLYWEEEEITIEATEFEMITQDGHFIMVKGYKYGMVNEEKEILIDYEYDLLVESVDGYFIYKKDDKYGVLDSEYEEIIFANYDGIALFYNIDSI